MQEAELLHTLGKHPNLVAMLEAMRCDNTIYICMELVSDGTISHVLSKGQPILPLIKRWTHDVLCGLVYLHDHDIVHRDIKCANVLVTEDCTAKLVDFGASAVLNQVSQGTLRAKGLRGTPFFMAPEVFEQRGESREGLMLVPYCFCLESHD